MGRPATGWTKHRNGAQGERWYTQITLTSGKRSPWIPLPKEIAATDEAGAKVAAKRVSDGARANGFVSESIRETVGEWWKRFLKAKEGKATAGDMKGRAEKWILPGIEAKDVRSLAPEDIERIVKRLDDAISAFTREGPGRGRLSPSTAANVWGDLRHALNEAVRAKDPDLRVLKENPALNVRGPEGGDERQGQILYSDEIVDLLRGRSVDPKKIDVPLYRRQMYAVAIYLKARSAELEALTVDDVDLRHGTVKINKQAVRKSARRLATKPTKTRRSRSPDIEAHLYPLIEWLVRHPQGIGKRLLRMPPPEDRAEDLRRDLLTVGVTREALHIEGNSIERALTFHDLRDTGLTHMAVRGDPAIKIQWAGGHTDFKTTQGYIQRGQDEGRRIGDPLPPLPSELIPDGPVRTSAGAPDRLAFFSLQGETVAARSRKSLPNLWAERDSNP